MDECRVCGADLGDLDWHRNLCEKCAGRYVSCDDPACRALLEPRSPDEVWAAYKHWKTHQSGFGCSHGN